MVIELSLLRSEIAFALEFKAIVELCWHIIPPNKHSDSDAHSKKLDKLCSVSSDACSANGITAISYAQNNREAFVRDLFECLKVLCNAILLTGKQPTVCQLDLSAFERYCNEVFDRVAGAEEELQASEIAGYQTFLQQQIAVIKLNFTVAAAAVIQLVKKKGIQELRGDSSQYASTKEAVNKSLMKLKIEYGFCMGLIADLLALKSFPGSQEFLKRINIFNACLKYFAAHVEVCVEAMMGSPDLTVLEAMRDNIALIHRFFDPFLDALLTWFDKFLDVLDPNRVYPFFLDTVSSLNALIRLTRRVPALCASYKASRQACKKYQAAMFEIINEARGRCDINKFSEWRSVSFNLDSLGYYIGKLNALSQSVVDQCAMRFVLKFCETVQQEINDQMGENSSDPEEVVLGYYLDDMGCHNRKYATQRQLSVAYEKAGNHKPSLPDFDSSRSYSVAGLLADQRNSLRVKSKVANKRVLHDDKLIQKGLEMIFGRVMGGDCAGYDVIHSQMALLHKELSELDQGKYQGNEDQNQLEGKLEKLNEDLESLKNLANEYDKNAAEMLEKLSDRVDPEWVVMKCTNAKFATKHLICVLGVEASQFNIVWQRKISHYRAGLEARENARAESRVGPKLRR